MLKLCAMDCAAVGDLFSLSEEMAVLFSGFCFIHVDQQMDLKSKDKTILHASTIKEEPVKVQLFQ